MGAILDAMMRKKQLDAAADENLAAVPQALDAFVQARQRSAMIEMERRKTQAAIDNLVGETLYRTRKLDIEDRIANVQAKQADAEIANLESQVRERSVRERLLSMAEGGLSGGDGVDAGFGRNVVRGLLSKEFNIPFEETATTEERESAGVAAAEQKAREAAAVDAAKPYGDVEAGIIEKGERLPLQIDGLIKLIEENPVFQKDGTKPPTAGERIGAMKIQAFGEKGWESGLLRFLTKGKAREAGNILKEIKVLAFGEGGKTLTEYEKMTVQAALDPSDKSEDEWVASLKRARDALVRKAELVKKKGVPDAGKDVLKGYDAYLEAIR